jgi:hypothetical protein
LPASVTLEDKAKAANTAAQIPNGTYGFKERVRKTLGLYQISAMPMILKRSMPLPTYPKPSYCPGATVRAGKNREPIGFISVSKTAEYSPNPLAPQEIPDPIYPKTVKTPSVVATYTPPQTSICRVERLSSTQCNLHTNASARANTIVARYGWIPALMIQKPNAIPVERCDVRPSGPEPK